MANPALIYDPRYHTFESWACLMCELYDNQNIEIPIPGLTWQDWASGLKALDNFNNEGIPGPYVFDKWDDWATAVMNAVNPATS